MDFGNFFSPGLTNMVSMYLYYIQLIGHQEPVHSFGQEHATFTFHLIRFDSFMKNVVCVSPPRRAIQLTFYSTMCARTCICICVCVACHAQLIGQTAWQSGRAPLQRRLDVICVQAALFMVGVSVCYTIL